MSEVIERLPGEGETKLIERTRIRRGCDNCGEPATNRNTYLNDGTLGARANPTSSAYRKDDCSWCSDHDEYLCGDCHARNVQVAVPDGYHWCSTFHVERFAHMFLRWQERELDQAKATES